MVSVREGSVVEKALGLEIIEVVEQAALASARLMGKGLKNEADAVAVEAMRNTMNKVRMRGRIVIGEGERDEAPMLYIGEEVGICTQPNAADVCRLDELLEIDIAVDPCEGTNLVASGSNNSMAVLSLRREAYSMLLTSTCASLPLLLKPKAKSILTILPRKT
jgi:fructose-1,6-bisphosphatase II / sedoheptulose-1,7-bisphosphatase